MTVPLLQVQNVSKRFETVQALKDVTFAMQNGETWAIVGGSGSGKTTLAKILCRLLAPDQGNIFWEGRSSKTFNRIQWAQCLQMVFQDPYASLNPKLSVAFQLGEALRMARNNTQRVEDLLMAVGLSADAGSRYPFQFSGGQRQRIAIARALALHPKLLILDEPLSALDYSTQEQMIALFQSIGHATGLAFLLITHDLDLAQRLASQVLVLQEGRMVEQGAAHRVLTSPEHPYTRALVDAILR